MKNFIEYKSKPFLSSKDAHNEMSDEYLHFKKSKKEINKDIKIGIRSLKKYSKWNQSYLSLDLDQKTIQSILKIMAVGK